MDLPFLLAIAIAGILIPLMIAVLLVKQNRMKTQLNAILDQLEKVTRQVKELKQFHDSNPPLSENDEPPSRKGDDIIQATIAKLEELSKVLEQEGERLRQTKEQVSGENDDEPPLENEDENPIIEDDDKGKDHPPEDMDAPPIEPDSIIIDPKDMEDSPPTENGTSIIESDNIITIEDETMMNPHRNKKTVRQPIKDWNRKPDIRLPNGKAGSPYQYSLRYEFPADTYSDAKLLDGKGLGISFDPLLGLLEGELVKGSQGDHELELEVTKTNGKVETRTLLFTINPDPRSLWKNLEPDPTLPYAKASEDSKALPACSGDERSLIAASKRGRSHAHEGSFRDDDFEIASVDGWDILMVADGAGSAKYSREGARIACQATLDYLRQELGKGEFSKKMEQLLLNDPQAFSSETERQIKLQTYHLLPGAALNAVRKINEEAKGREAKLKDYSTTLLLSITKKVAGRHLVCSFWIGDGAIALLDLKSESVEILGQPDGGEFAGQTRFLTMMDVFKDSQSLYNRLDVKYVEDLTALVLMTDGVSDPKFETDDNLKKFGKWQAFWEELAPVLAYNDEGNPPEDKLLEWMDFWSPGNHDDRTIAIMY